MSSHLADLRFKILIQIRHRELPLEHHTRVKSVELKERTKLLGGLYLLITLRV